MRYDDISVRLLDGQAVKQLSSFVAEKDCYLRFRVRYKGRSARMDRWLSEAEVVSVAPQVMYEWVHHYQAQGYLPLQHEVNIIAGGPPCQSVSGNNRQAMRDAILGDKRNRQVRSILCML